MIVSADYDETIHKVKLTDVVSGTNGFNEIINTITRKVLSSLFESLRAASISFELAELRAEEDTEIESWEYVFASFLLARDRLGLSLRAPEVHRQVIKRMYDRKPSIGNNLHLLRHNRNLADYDTKAPLSYADAQQAIELGERTVEGINALKKLGGRNG